MPRTKAPVPPELPDAAELRFVQFHHPRLEAGDYKLRLSHKLKVDGKEHGFGDSPEVYFSVKGHRWELPNELLHAVYPPPSSRGPFHRVLPHVILERSTLPWERNPKPGMKRGAELAADDRHSQPWLAILLFDAGSAPEPQVVAAGEVGKVSAKRQDGKEFVRVLGAAKSGVAKALDIEATEHADDRLTVIDVPLDLLQTIAPRWDDLPATVHVRKVSRPDQPPPGHVVTIQGLAAALDAAREVLAEQAGAAGPAAGTWLDQEHPPSWHTGGPLLELGAGHLVVRTAGETIRVDGAAPPKDEQEAKAWLLDLLPPSPWRARFLGGKSGAGKGGGHGGKKGKIPSHDHVELTSRFRHDVTEGTGDTARVTHHPLGELGVAAARLRPGGEGTAEHYRASIGILPEPPAPVAWTEQAVVVGTRLPPRDADCVAHLVSLENAYKEAPAGHDPGGDRHKIEEPGLIKALQAARSASGAAPSEKFRTPWTHSGRTLAWAEKDTALIEIGAGHLALRQGAEVKSAAGAPKDETEIEKWIKALLPKDWEDRLFQEKPEPDKQKDPAAWKKWDKHRLRNRVSFSGRFEVGGRSHRLGVAVSRAKGNKREMLRALVAFLPELPVLAVPEQGGKDVPGLVRLVSLHSWAFRCDAAAHDLLRLLMHLDTHGKAELHELSARGGGGGLRLPVPENAPAAVADRIRAGYTPWRHRMRRGDRGVSWYRGPLVSDAPEQASAPPVVRGSDQLLVIDRATGLIDASYAAAWELGRLLALADTPFATALHRWRTEHEHELHHLEQRARHGHLALAEGPARGAHVLPGELEAWLTELSLLEDVPYNYLVPDERMLPAESIRFFTVDPDWIACLTDGAFAVGRALGADHRGDAKRAGALPRPPRTSGFLLRSEVVGDFPGLLIEGYAAAGDVGDSLPLATHPDQESFVKLRRLRAARLAPDTLLCLYHGGPLGLELSVVDLHLHPQTLHFGLEEDVGGKLIKCLRNPLTGRREGVWSGKRQQPPAHKVHPQVGLKDPPPGDVLVPDAIPWRTPHDSGDPATSGVLHVGRLFEEVGHRLERFALDHKYTSADFALQLLDAPVLIRFLRWDGPLPDAREVSA